MAYKATTKIGATTIQVEAKDIKDLFRQVGVFSDLPNKCDCGSGNIRLRHRVAKEFDFYSLLCECGKEFSLGQSKDQVSLFPKGPWAIPQRGGQQQDDGGGYQQRSNTTSSANDMTDEIPF